MTLNIHGSAAHVQRRRDRLTRLHDRIRQQISDAECLVATLDEYCRENPDDCACVGSDPNWREQIIRQREDLTAMLLAVRERVRLATAVER
jgi:hypothetical protein